MCLFYNHTSVILLLLTLMVILLLRFLSRRDEQRKNSMVNNVHIFLGRIMNYDFSRKFVNTFFEFLLLEMKPKKIIFFATPLLMKRLIRFKRRCFSYCITRHLAILTLKPLRSLLCCLSYNMNCQCICIFGSVLF